MTTGATIVSDRVFAEIKASLAAKRTGNPVMAEAMAASGAPEVINPLFSHEEIDDAGKVAISSLVPSWDKRRKTPDIMVRVHDTSIMDDEVKARVPAINPDYRPNMDALSLLAYAIEKSDTGILLTGLPSVGKSSLVEYFCAITNRPFYRFNYNGTMDASSLLGTQSARDGSTYWHDGMITEAIKVPFAVVLHDEWTFAPPEVIAALQYVLERNGKLILADKPGTVADKTVVPAEGVRMVFADNTRGNGDTSGKFVGTQPQNSATIDRIGTFIEVEFLSERDECAMLKAMFPHATDKLLTSCVKTANLCRSAYVQGNVNTVMSLRVLSSWINHALNLKDIDKALEISFLNRFDSESERTAIKGFLNVTMGKGR
jgi:cobaltochelatase CobS